MLAQTARIIRVSVGGKGFAIANGGEFFEDYNYYFMMSTSAMHSSSMVCTFYLHLHTWHQLILLSNMRQTGNNEKCSTAQRHKFY